MLGRVLLPQSDGATLGALAKGFPTSGHPQG